MSRARLLSYAVLTVIALTTTGKAPRLTTLRPRDLEMVQARATREDAPGAQ